MVQSMVSIPPRYSGPNAALAALKAKVMPREMNTWEGGRKAGRPGPGGTPPSRPPENARLDGMRIPRQET